MGFKLSYSLIYQTHNQLSHIPNDGRTSWGILILSLLGILDEHLSNLRLATVCTSTVRVVTCFITSQNTWYLYRPAYLTNSVL